MESELIPIKLRGWTFHSIHGQQYLNRVECLAMVDHAAKTVAVVDCIPLNEQLAIAAEAAFQIVEGSEERKEQKPQRASPKGQPMVVTVRGIKFTVHFVHPDVIEGSAGSVRIRNNTLIVNNSGNRRQQLARMRQLLAAVFRDQYPTPANFSGDDPVAGCG